jgi:hypothetical protein
MFNRPCTSSMACTSTDFAPCTSVHMSKRLASSFTLHAQPALAHRVKACRHDDEVRCKLVQDGQQTAAQQTPCTAGRVSGRIGCRREDTSYCPHACLQRSEHCCTWCVLNHVQPSLHHHTPCCAAALTMSSDPARCAATPLPTPRPHSHSAECSQVVSVARAGPVPGHVHAAARTSPAAHLLHVASAGEEVATVVPGQAHSSSSSMSQEHHAAGHFTRTGSVSSQDMHQHTPVRSTLHCAADQHLAAEPVPFKTL